MKRFIIAAGTLMMIMTACKKTNDRIFDESPNERIAATLSAYEEQLAGAAYGWRALIEPAGGGAYGFYFQFNNQNRVQMFSDFTLESATTAKESSFRLKGLQQPALLFDTYSYLHVLADPDNRVNGGTRGAGLRSDFEFYFAASSPDTIHLVGRFNGSKATLVRATQQEQAAYNNGDLGNAYAFNNIASYVNYFKRVTLGGVEYEINANLGTRTLFFSWLDSNGELQTFSTPYYYDITGVRFEDPLVAGNQVIPGFTNINWNSGTSLLSFTANETTVTVTGGGQPLKVDLQAPLRWYNYAASISSFWVSLDGFHFNGTDDAFSITQIPGFLYMGFYTPGSVNGIDEDLAGFVLSLSGGTGIYDGIFFNPPVFTQDGRAIFSVTDLTSDEDPLYFTALAFNQAAGFYFVQTGPESYDMVSAADGKLWISWIW